MSEDTRNLLFFTLLSCLCVLLWAVTTVAVYVDLRRRNLSGVEQAAWVALALFFPGLGFGAYLFARLLAALFTPPSNPPPHAGGEGGGGGKKRVTFLQRLNEPEVRTGTIPAVELIRPTVPDQGTTVPDQGTSPLDSPAQPGTALKQILTLIVLEGPHAGEQFILNRLPAAIGREPDAAIQLSQDQRVSRLHAEIYRKDGALRIRDLRSTHGTQINGFSIDDKTLEPGDKIEVGLTTMLVEVE